MGDEYDFEKLAREIVTSRLMALDSPAEAAAEIAKKIIVTGVTSTKVRQDPRLTVLGVCRGVMSGMLLINKELPEAAAGILRVMPAIAHDVHLDPQELMTWGMEGIASVALMAGQEVRYHVQQRIEESFMGAGPVFQQLCQNLAGK